MMFPGTVWMDGPKMQQAGAVNGLEHKTLYSAACFNFYKNKVYKYNKKKKRSLIKVLDYLFTFFSLFFKGQMSLGPAYLLAVLKC